MVLYSGASPDGAQQLGAVAHGGGSVVQGGGELGGLVEVVLLVFRRLVFNTCRMEGKQISLKSSQRTNCVRRVFLVTQQFG